MHIQNQTKEMQATFKAAQVCANIVAKSEELELTPPMVKALADVICIMGQEYPTLLDAAVVRDYTGAFFYTEGGAPHHEPAYAALSTAVTCITLGHYA